jgi:GNAT superfamily N-acetyltransferase
VPTELSIDWLPERRLAELQRFIEEHWRRGHVLARNQALIRWQHRSAQPERLSVLVAEEAGGLVAMLGFIAFSACLQGERARGGWMTNWLVVPEHRGRGLGRALVERALDREFDVVGALGGNETTQTVLSRLGFEGRPSMPRWLRIASADALADLLGDHAAAYPEEAWRAWRAHERLGRNSPRAQVTGWSHESAERWDSIFRERFAGTLVGAWRDADHLRRRFVEHPVFSYEILFADTGIAVYRIETVRDSGHSLLRIVDFLAEPGAGDALAAALVDAMERERVVFADFFCASRRFGEPLENAGFVLEGSLPASLPARFQPLDFADRPLASSLWITGRHTGSGRGWRDAADLYVTRSDSDLDRPN